MGKGDIFIQAILYLQFIYPQYIKMTKRDLTPDSVHSFLKQKEIKLFSYYYISVFNMLY